MLDQRRLLERFQSLPELRRAGDITPVAEVRPDINASVDLALTPEPQGEAFTLQLTKMAELNTLAMSLKEGLALDTKVASGAVDLASLPAAALSRQPAPLVNSAEVRPMAPSYIQVPLNDSQWQSDFNNRVTWLARAGGNQSAEIRLNPANLGPIEVRVMMKDDQASITFSAQHGAVRDAIEASLPRLREMFLSSGMQLAQANVSDQPLQEQRQRQQPGAGDGDSQTRQGQPDISDDIASTTSFVESHTSGLVDSLDLYV
ncbi:MAG: flagellar hook-length control protein FliK, partial [Pseudomonadota bacterium]|nr:flagellar hook-length control protein FliK [Pseudomonadota bacterium]